MSVFNPFVSDCTISRPKPREGVRECTHFNCGWSLRTGAMWAGLGLVLALCLLPGGGAETEAGATRCKSAPPWSIREVEPMKEALGQASRMDDLRLKLQKQGLVNVTYMVVNHQGEAAQRLHGLLRQKLSENIALHQQRPHQVDVWQTLAGDKDDFLVYDRCGRLTYHIALPYSILSTPYVEEAIRKTYCNSICGSCQYESLEQQAACNRTVEPEVAVVEGDAGSPPESEGAHGHGHDHGHHHHHHTHSGRHGSEERRGKGGSHGQHQHDPEQDGYAQSGLQAQAQAEAQVVHDFQQPIGGDLGQVRQMEARGQP
ncbi:hypothetical protein AAFF_G00066150 [Aldrovandia affinis]|uniref:Selenoprotein P N-terminal domain-containing protein n=1 Tax=Aldrovandia affinis TaxID=143900 RepID=A0AAD7T418_9TELE|nr:hypothetical protein AAFF_G00066150 [Aldrovandia affinis]